MRYPITKRQFIAWLKQHPRRNAGRFSRRFGHTCPIENAIKQLTGKLPDNSYPTLSQWHDKWPERCARAIDRIAFKNSLNLISWRDLTRKQALDALKEAGEI